MSVSKIQAAISHPSLLTACQMACAVSKPVTHYRMHTYRPGNLRDENPKRRRLWHTPGCNAMKEEEEEEEFLSVTDEAVLMNTLISNLV
jgi:hypothetical protein